MRKKTIYNDDDMMLYVDEVIELISKGQYYSARMDQIKLACVDKFGDKWLASIEKLLELSTNPEDCDYDNGVQMIDNTELLENQKHSDNNDDGGVDNNNNDDDDDDDDNDYSEITSLNEKV
jgi:hypothetical protein